MLEFHFALKNKDFKDRPKTDPDYFDYKNGQYNLVIHMGTPDPSNPVSDFWTKYTKFYEEFFRYKIEYHDTKSINLKGEITLVVSHKINFNKTSNNLDESDKKKIKKLIKKLSIKEIIDLIKEGKDISKKVIYNYCLKLKNEK